MKSVLSVVFIFLLATTGIQAQKVAIGIFGGVSNYLGDLSDDIVIKETHPAAGFFFKYNANNFLTFRLGLNTATISGKDENFAPGTAARMRNLSFKTHILEASLIMEINLTGYNVEDRRFSPYIFGGIAGYNFNPKALYQGEWVELQPLSTEGQETLAFPERKQYSLYHYSVPVGLGFKIGMGSGVTFALEAGVRKTFTDYLDDVSLTYVDANSLILEKGELAYRLSNRTGEVNPPDYVPLDLGNDDSRGDSNPEDWYGFAGFTISYTLGVPMNGGSGSKKGCYSF